MVHDAAGPLVHAGVRAHAHTAQPAAEVNISVNFRRLGRVEDKAVALRQAFAVEDVVPGSDKGAVHGVAHGVIGNAVPAVGEIPGVADAEEVGTLAHELLERRKDRADQLPVLQIGGGVLEHHAAQRLLMGRDQQPVAMISFHPESLGIAEVYRGIALRRLEEDAVLDPVFPVCAGGVHDALGALAAVAEAGMAGIEQMVQPVRILQDRAGAESGVGIGHLAEVQHHAVILIPAEILCGIFPDRVVALAVVVRVVQIVQFQLSVVGHKGHDVAHIAALRRGKQGVIHRLIGFIGKLFTDENLFRALLLRGSHRLRSGSRRGAAGG